MEASLRGADRLIEEYAAISLRPGNSLTGTRAKEDCRAEGRTAEALRPRNSLATGAGGGEPGGAAG